MPRPRKAVAIRRIELRLAADDPMILELVQEARLRGVELTQHIYDLLRSRYLLRHGQSFQDLLWVPGSATNQRAALSLAEPIEQLTLHQRVTCSWSICLQRRGTVAHQTAHACTTALDAAILCYPASYEIPGLTQSAIFSLRFQLGGGWMERVHSFSQPLPVILYLYG
jgi:hypothetical protein